MAIGRYKTQPEQAQALGISQRTLTTYLKKYEIPYIKIKNTKCQ